MADPEFDKRPVAMHPELSQYELHMLALAVEHVHAGCCVAFSLGDLAAMRAAISKLNLAFEAANR